MNVQYHPAVEQDVAGALKYYDEISPVLGDEFKKELRHFIALAVANPGRSILSVPNSAEPISNDSRIIFFTAKSPTAFASHWFDITNAIRITDWNAIDQQAFDTAINLGGRDCFHFAGADSIATTNGFIGPSGFQFGFVKTGD